MIDNADTSHDAAPSVLNIGVLGSCRVANPIKEMENIGRVTYTPSAPIRFLHNPMEMVQSLKILHGQTSLPSELMALSCQARALTEDRSYSNTLGRAGVIICEVSSIRIAEYNGHQLQINLLRNFLIESGMSQAGLRDLFARKDLPTQDKITDPLAADIVATGHFYEMDKDQIKQALADLMTYIDRPVLFVGFIEEREDQRTIAQRTAVNSAVAEFAAERPETSFFNPTSLIAKHGFHTVVRDMGHYQDAFVPTVGEELLAEVEAFFTTLPR